MYRDAMLRPDKTSVKTWAAGLTFLKRQNNYMTAAEADVGHVTALGACSDASNAFHTAPPASPFGKPDAALGEKHMRSIAI